MPPVDKLIEPSKGDMIPSTAGDVDVARTGV